MVIIVLLNLPLDLPSDAPARQAGLTSFVDRVPEWISRCEYGLMAYWVTLKGLTIRQVNPTKAVCLQDQTEKPMLHIPTVDWHA